MKPKVQTKIDWQQRVELIKPLIGELMWRNRRTEGEHQYTVPSPETYPYQWLWDSCFHAIILSHTDIDSAKKEILSLVSRQLANGMIPHMIYWKKAAAINIDWGVEGTSSITQPPILAYAVSRIWDLDQDKKFLENVYPSLYHFYNYLLNERDPHRHHLIGIINPDESGEDNSPRFDVPLGLAAQHTLKENFDKRLELFRKNIACKFDAPFCMKNFFWVKDVPFNALMVENLQVMSRLAKELARSEDSEFFDIEAKKVGTAMRNRMWEGGLFWPTFGTDYTKIKAKTWAIFAPMVAKIVSKEEANQLVTEYLFNPREFGAKFGVPTVSKSDPSFDPKGFWRGPTWIATNWFIYRGLKNYGFDDAAERIRESSMRLIELSGFREQFNPDTGEGYGAYDFTWGGLVIDMV